MIVSGFICEYHCFPAPPPPPPPPHHHPSPSSPYFYYLRPMIVLLCPIVPGTLVPALFYYLCGNLSTTICLPVLGQVKC